MIVPEHSDNYRSAPRRNRRAVQAPEKCDVFSRKKYLDYSYLHCQRESCKHQATISYHLVATCLARVWGKSRVREKTYLFLPEPAVNTFSQQARAGHVITAAYSTSVPNYHQNLCQNFFIITTRKPNRKITTEPSLSWQCVQRIISVGSFQIFEISNRHSEPFKSVNHLPRPVPIMQPTSHQN